MRPHGRARALFATLTAACLQGFPVLLGQAGVNELHGTTPELTLARIFTDHMVLQRQEEVPVFGQDRPGQSVTVMFAGQSKTAKAERNGQWRINLDPMPASVTGRTLTVKGSSILHIEDVVIGEVWLAAGQSNMDFPVHGSATAPHPDNYHLIRMCNWSATVDTSPNTVYGVEEIDKLTPARFYRGSWTVIDEDSVRSPSAVAYFFANALARELTGKGRGGSDVPIGVVEVAVGGTSTEAFIPVSALQTDDDLFAAFADPRGVRTLGQWTSTRIARNMGGIRHVSPKLPHPHPYAPGFLFHTGIAHIAPFAFRGVIWYQGESNAEFTEPRYDWPGNRIADYQTKVMTKLVNSWRDAFGKHGFPFYMVQLPRINAPNRAKWPWYREAQSRVAATLEGVELAIAPEFGSKGGNVHPRNKEPVGERLAYIARNRLYGEAIPYSGPVYRSQEIAGSRISLRFDHIGDGLFSSDGEPLRHFEISGKDGRFFPAKARIVDDMVEVSAAAVPEPVAVRYGWDMNLDVNLYAANNVENLPAAPFRTDDFREERHLKLFLLTGQSNSLGTTNGGETDRSPGHDAADRHVMFFWHNVVGAGLTIGTSDGAFTTLREQPGHVYRGSPTHWGPEFEFARTLYRSGVRDFGIIKASRAGGGNSFWLKGSEDDHMYRHIRETVAAAAEDLRIKGHTFEIVGLMYLQGESDDATEAAQAGNRLKTLTDNLRADLPNAANLYTVAAGTTAPGDAVDTVVRARQKAVADSFDYIDFFPNTDLSDLLGPDGLHLGRVGKFVVGNRFAQAFLDAGIVSREYGRLVFIGDSITQGGKGHPSYRYRVFTNLINAGVKVGDRVACRFVGSVTGAFQNNAGSTPILKSQSFVNRHDGHWGWRAAWTSGRVALPAGRYNRYNLGHGTLVNWIGLGKTFETWDQGTMEYTGDTYFPDTAIIQIGINDLADGTPPSQVRADLSTMIDQLRSANPYVRIHLCQVVYADTVSHDAVDSLNELLPQLVAEKNAVSSISPVWLIATNVDFDPDTMTHDKVHPNAAGEVYLGDRISGGLSLIEMPRPWVAEIKPDLERGERTDLRRFNGSDIYNSGSYVRGWSAPPGIKPALVGRDELALEHAGGGADTLDGTATGWQICKTGAWRFEIRLRFVDNPNGFILWLGTGANRILVEIHANQTQDYEGDSFRARHNNLDGKYHSFTVEHRPESQAYHVWRDGIRLTKPAGAGYDMRADDGRLLLGDYTRGTFGDGFKVVIDYVKFRGQ